MSLTKFTDNTNIISELSDTPIETAAELKGKFDSAGTKIKNYLNNILTEEIEQLVSSTRTNLQTLTTNLRTEMNTAITNLRTEMQDYANTQISADNQSKYPIGKIILSSEDTNPSTYLGFGTWTRIAKGRTLVGVDENDSDFNVAEKSGGEKEHILTVNEIPSHNHSIGYDTRRNANSFTDSNSIGFVSGGTIRTTTIPTNSVGGNGAHNNMPPYFTCYVWKRIS